MSKCWKFSLLLQIYDLILILLVNHFKLFYMAYLPGNKVVYKWLKSSSLYILPLYRNVSFTSIWIVTESKYQHSHLNKQYPIFSFLFFSANPDPPALWWALCVSNHALLHWSISWICSFKSGCISLFYNFSYRCWVKSTGYVKPQQECGTSPCCQRGVGCIRLLVWSTSDPLDLTHLQGLWLHLLP